MSSGPCANSTHRPAMTSPDQARGQFLRVEKFAVQAPRNKTGGNNISKVANEAVRTEGFCPHVEHPLPPTVLYGVGPIEAARQAEIWAKQQTSPFLHKPSQTQMTRKYRADKPCALVGVISVPPEWLAGSRWSQFKHQCLEWLKKKYGEDRLRSLIEHLDERCLHLHFWVIPRPGENFHTIHQGEKALDDVGRLAARIVRDAAYKAAMARLLDEFHAGVGSHFGLERETVGGNRVSREEWLRRQHLDRLREREIQRRIDEAVEVALSAALRDYRHQEITPKLISKELSWHGPLSTYIEHSPPTSAQPQQLGPIVKPDAGESESSNLFAVLRGTPPSAYESPEAKKDPSHEKETSIGIVQTQSMQWVRPRGG
jgi:hypothetical protein